MPQNHSRLLFKLQILISVYLANAVCDVLSASAREERRVFKSLKKIDTWLQAQRMYGMASINKKYGHTSIDLTL